MFSRIKSKTFGAEAPNDTFVASFQDTTHMEITVELSFKAKHDKAVHLLSAQWVRHLHL